MSSWFYLRLQAGDRSTKLRRPKRLLIVHDGFFSGGHSMGVQQSGDPVFDVGERSHDFLNALASDVLEGACLENPHAG